jgi:hypothetical protein
MGNGEVLMKSAVQHVYVAVIVLWRLTRELGGG